MPKTVQSFGDSGEDREIDALWKEIEALKKRVPTSIEGEPDNLAVEVLNSIIVQSEGGTPTFNVAGIEFDSGFTVELDRASGLALIKLSGVVIGSLMIGQPIIGGEDNDLLFVKSGQLGQDSELKRAAPAGDRLSDALSVSQFTGAPTNKALFAGVLTNDSATEYSGLEVARVCSVPITSDLFATGFSFAIGESGVWSDPHIGFMTCRRTGDVKSGKFVWGLSKNNGSGVGVLASLMFLDYDGNLQLVPRTSAGAYGYRLANVTAASVSAPASGSLIHDTGVVKHYTGSAWETLSPVSSSGPPTGTILMYGAASAPTDYLLCDGASYLRATYAALFAVIGTTYGSADGTHFNVPDLRQKFPLGKAASGTGSTLGGTGGAIDHTHTVDPPNTTSGNQNVLSYFPVAPLSGETNTVSGVHTHDVDIASFNSGSNNPPYISLQFIIKY